MFTMVLWVSKNRKTQNGVFHLTNTWQKFGYLSKNIRLGVMRLPQEFCSALPKFGNPSFDLFPLGFQLFFIICNHIGHRPACDGSYVAPGFTPHSCAFPTARRQTARTQPRTSNARHIIQALQEGVLPTMKRSKVWQLSAKRPRHYPWTSPGKFNSMSAP